ncbi:RagB/SusD family nutrient uptake outer membrane protein [Polaribacter batillariae]|uniref:RagB/SusD family nutrient uptake outer membrane protein n=1 Tax=Polaribacter batillariae TaxID=2808900 RepID=A0ABX7SRM5_9FLAO|nr:RagB/SusD family nutrient uptake outer membrane protein [Polaribacter batillariae]QTD36909.1 RagB/SusD family nutrient uptake outer membrane protein [Polaribacter batillariae]
MRVFKIYFLFAILMFSCESPDDFLDVIPTDKVIPTTVEDFDKLMNNPLISRSRQENISFMDPDVFMSEVSFGSITGDNVNINAYTWQSELYNITENDPDYNETYQFIHISNQVLADIDEASLGVFNENNRQNIKAEAYAQRAMEYFLAVTEYAPAYNPENTTTPAIPMPLKVDLQALLSKSSIGEVYNQIIADLNRSLDLFSIDYPAINETANFRPGVASIYALLAEVYLFMGDFEQSKINSNKALDLYNYLYDWNEIDFIDPSNPWQGYNINDFQFSTLNKSVIWNRGHRSDYQNPFQLYHPDLEALYDKDNDRRWYLRSTQTSFGDQDVSPYYIYLFSRSETNVGLTTSRLLLTNAEAKARTNDGTGAIAALNTLLEKRISNFTPLTHVDNPTTLLTIKNERRKELHGTALNVFDQKRYRIYGDNVPTYTRTNPETGETFTLEPGGNGYRVNIPAKVRELNPNLN